MTDAIPPTNSGADAHARVSVIRPPEPLNPAALGTRSVFLGGSITTAPNWRSELTTFLGSEAAGLPAGSEVWVLDPQRDGATFWERGQTTENGEFVEQVEWELQGQEVAGVVAVYFAPETQAPVSLLEMGLAAGSGRLVVCCPEGFWRRGNVQIVCRRFGVPCCESLDEMRAEVAKKLAAME